MDLVGEIGTGAFAVRDRDDEEEERMFSRRNSGGVAEIFASPVPVPAALPLFATALAGLGLFGWRKKKAQ